MIEIWNDCRYKEKTIKFLSSKNFNLLEIDHSGESYLFVKI